MADKSIQQALINIQKYILSIYLALSRDDCDDGVNKTIKLKFARQLLNEVLDDIISMQDFEYDSARATINRFEEAIDKENNPYYTYSPSLLSGGSRLKQLVDNLKVQLDKKISSMHAEKDQEGSSQFLMPQLHYSNCIEHSRFYCGAGNMP